MNFHKHLFGYIFIELLISDSVIQVEKSISVYLPVKQLKCYLFSISHIQK